MPGKNMPEGAEQPLHKQLGSRMQQARISARGGKGFKQEELAQKLEVTPVTLSRWETGARSPSFEMLERLAEIVDKPLTFFFEEEQQASDAEQTFFRKYRELSEEDKKQVLDFIEFRRQRWYNEKFGREQT